MVGWKVGWDRCVGCVRRAIACVLLICFSLCSGAPVTLSDQNSSMELDPTNAGGVFNWLVNDLDQLTQQWYWLRIGDGVPERSIDTLDLLSVNVVDTNPLFDPAHDTIDLIYRDPNGRFQIEVQISLFGGQLGNPKSAVTELIAVHNLGAGALPLRFFTYNNFDLNESAVDTSVAFAGGNGVSQVDGGATTHNSIVSPFPTRVDVGLGGTLLASLNDAAATTLSNNVGPVGPGDLSFALQWNATIAPGNSYLVSIVRSTVVRTGPCSPGNPLGDCDDGVACTEDTCDTNTGLCVNTPNDALCDNGLYCDGAEVCNPVVGCQPGTPPCDDGIACTDDSCDEIADTCGHAPNHGACDDGQACTIDTCGPGGCGYAPVIDGTSCEDGMYCNGPETCRGGRCVDGADPCPPLACDETDDVCIGCVEPEDCDNGLFCDGVEDCQAGMCVDGPDPCVDPAHCDESNDRCICLTDAECTNDLFCDGVELCVNGTCTDGVDPCLDPAHCDEPNDRCICLADAECDNGQFCDGVEICVDGTCSDGPDPCIDLAHCDEPTDRCICISDTECFDGLPCTQDLCVGGSCTYPPEPNGLPCDDGLFCNGAETCQDGVCTDGPDPCIDLAHCDEVNDVCLECMSEEDCDDGSVCTIDVCFNGDCLHSAVPNGTLCEDPLFCNGPERCEGGLCVDGPDPCVDLAHCDEINDLCLDCVTAADCDDGVACTTNTCDPITHTCVYSPNDGACDNGLFCDGVEVCDPVLGCRPGVFSCDDAIACTVDGCDETNDVCTHVPMDDLCLDSLFCNGAERCDVLLGCRPGVNPCPNPSFPVCDESVDGCVECLIDNDCDDGRNCTLDRCVNFQCTHTSTDSLPPFVTALGTRTLAITPQPPGSIHPVALILTSPNFPCLFKYIDDNGILTDTPVFQIPALWGLSDSGTVVVVNQDVIPSANDNPIVYWVQADCGDGPAFYTGPGMATTFVWGDVTGDGFVSLDDILCMQRGFAGIFDCTFSALNLAPCEGDVFINNDDNLAVLNAFSGLPYPCAYPCEGGACCRGVVCTLDIEPDCVGTGGIFMGTGVTCLPQSCLPPPP